MQFPPPCKNILRVFRPLLTGNRILESTEQLLYSEQLSGDSETRIH